VSVVVTMMSNEAMQASNGRGYRKAGRLAALEHTVDENTLQQHSREPTGRKSSNYSMATFYLNLSLFCPEKSKPLTLAEGA
jgi:hypothetical protein